MADRPVVATRSLGLSEATIEDGRGRMLGHATSRCVLFRLDPALMASRGNGEVQQGSGPDPYLRAVDGDVRGQEFWDTTSGTDVMNQVAAGDFVPPCWLLMGLRAVNTAAGSMTVAMSTSPWLSNAFGVIYGGAIAFLSDATIIYYIDPDECIDCGACRGQHCAGGDGFQHHGPQGQLPSPRAPGW